MVPGFAEARRQLPKALWMVKKSELSNIIIVVVTIVFVPQKMCLPTRNKCFALSASCSNPNGVTKVDLELSAAAIVRAGSKQRNKVAVNKNLPR